MPTQSGKNILVAYKPESAFNTAPGVVTGAKQLRINPSPGLSTKRTTIQSPEVRSDGLSSMGRLGQRMADGSYNVPLTVGGLDDILEAIMRSTWVAAAAINVATLTSVTFTSSTIVAAAGSWITAGVRVGDVLRCNVTGTPAANNNVNVRVKAVTASTITVQGTPFTVDGTARTAGTVTILKKLKNGATPVKRSFYIEEYNQDIDVSEVFGGCKFIQLKVSGTPDGSATAEVQILGASGAVLASAASPFYSSPSLTSGINLVFADATVSFGGTDVVTCTAFEFTYTIAAKTEGVIGATTTPDVYDNDAKLSGSLSFIRQDLANVTTFLNETEVELHILLVEPESEPKDCVAFYIPRVKLTGADAPLGNDGAMIETLPFTSGKKEGVTGYDDTLMTISTSAP